MASPLDLVRLTPLMARGAGRPEVTVALIDGFVAVDHPSLTGQRIVVLRGAGRSEGGGECGRAGGGPSCWHGTFVAGVLSAGRSSVAPGICPGCTLLVRPVFAAELPGCRAARGARVEELAAAILESVEGGARVLNLSVAPERPSSVGHRELEGALDHAANRGVIVVVAAGNQGVLGTSAITRHPWTIPVIAYDRRGRPMNLSNLGGSIGARGVGGPGEGIVSLGVGDSPLTITGTSAATPFVAGTVALLMSEFPSAPATDVRLAVTRAGSSLRRTVVPPLLDAWAAYTTLLAAHRRRSAPAA
ncbi:S8 family serine peptidase [Kitasatospora sp. NPDC127067]|uniref:S8 family serine peptidase n=1 Tax=Kitasatospora sp. NPDC127067 TaxID=3347126 RepID=UPI0036671CC3